MSVLLLDSNQLPEVYEASRLSCICVERSLPQPEEQSLNTTEGDATDEAGRNTTERGTKLFYTYYTWLFAQCQVFFLPVSTSYHRQANKSTVFLFVEIKQHHMACMALNSHVRRIFLVPIPYDLDVVTEMRLWTGKC